MTMSQPRKRRIRTSTRKASNNNNEAIIPPSSWCISYQQLMEIDQEIRSKFGSDKYTEMNMRDIAREVIEPRCSEKGASYALTLNPKGLPVDTFVSHCWDGHFSALVKAIRNLYQTSVVKPNLWICAFALLQSQRASVISQQVGSKQDPLELSPFVVAIQNASSYLIVRNSRMDVFSRIWCVCELMYAWQSKLYPHRTSVTGPDAFGKLRTSVLDAQSSMLTDRDRILKVLFTEFDREKIDEIVHQLRTHDAPHYPDDDDNDDDDHPLPPPAPCTHSNCIHAAKTQSTPPQDEKADGSSNMEARRTSAPTLPKAARDHRKQQSNSKPRSKSLDKKELRAIMAGHREKNRSMPNMSRSKSLLEKKELGALIAGVRAKGQTKTQHLLRRNNTERTLSDSSSSDRKVLLDGLTAISVHASKKSATNPNNEAILVHAAFKSSANPNNNNNETDRRAKLQKAVSGLGKCSDHVSSSVRPKEIITRAKLHRALSDFGKCSDQQQQQTTTTMDTSNSHNNNMLDSSISGSGITGRRSRIKDTFYKLGESQSRIMEEKKTITTTRNVDSISPVRMPSRRQIAAGSRVGTRNSAPSLTDYGSGAKQEK